MVEKSSLHPTISPLSFPKTWSYTDNLSFLSHILDSTDDSYVFNPCNNYTSLQLQSTFHSDGLSQKYVFLTEDTSLKIPHNIYTEMLYIKSLISENILKEKFLYLLNCNHILTVIAITTQSLPLLCENIIDFVELEYISFVVLIDKNSRFHIYSGMDYLCTLIDKKMIGTIYLSLGRFDKILIRNNNQFWILQVPILCDVDKTLNQFWKLLFVEFNEKYTFKNFYDKFWIYLIRNFVKNSSIVQIFIYFICQNFNVNYIEQKYISIHIKRMKGTIASIASLPDYNYSNLCAYFSNFHLILYKYILKFYNSLINSIDYFNINVFQSILSSIYASYKNIIQWPFDIMNLWADIPRLDICLTLPSCNNNYDSKKLVKASYLTEIAKNHTIFQFANPNIFYNKNILINTRKYFDWDQETKIFENRKYLTNLLDIFKIKSLNSVFYFIFKIKVLVSCYLNSIFSKPIGRGCLNFGLGNIETKFYILENNQINLKAKVLTKYDGSILSWDIKLKEKDIDEKTMIWPKFHNGVATALIFIKENKNVKKCKNVYDTIHNKEFWLKQAIQNLPYEEIGGFLFGCGLLGHFYKFPFESPFYLTHLYYSKDPITISGLLLGLGVSNIQIYKKESPLYVSNIERIFCYYYGIVEEIDPLLKCYIKKKLKKFESVEAPVEDTYLWICVSSVISLGLMYLSSTNHLILKTLKHNFDSLQAEIKSYKPFNKNFKGIIYPANKLQNDKLRAIAIGISIGLINLNNPNNQFTWDKYYNTLIEYFNKSGSCFNHLLESTFIMIGLTYLRTNNENAAKILCIPLKRISEITIPPYLLIVVYWFKGLILEKDMKKSLKNIYKNIPSWAKNIIKTKWTNLNIIFEARLTYAWSIVTGRLYALCFKYISTCDKTVKILLTQFVSDLTMTIDIYKKHKRAYNPAFLYNLKQCLSLIILGLSLVFAGSCDKNLYGHIKLLQELFKPIPNKIEQVGLLPIPFYSSQIGGNHLYGYHMTLNMALSFLCMSNGFLTFSPHSNESYSMLVISLYPVFSCDAFDNYNYFQPLRNLYTLACTKSRYLILIDKDYDKNIKPKPVILRYHHSKGKSRKRKIFVRSPQKIMLQQFHRYDSIEITSSYYENIIVKSNLFNQYSEKTNLFEKGNPHILLLTRKPHVTIYKKSVKYLKSCDKNSYSFALSPNYLFMNSIISSKKMTKYIGKIPIKYFNTVKEIFMQNKIDDNKFIMDILNTWHNFMDKVININQKNIFNIYEPIQQNYNKKYEHQELDTSLKLLFASILLFYKN
ncbi:hypothetical protein HZS_1534 [Henneguya salminicola]|nr:hypothetical protein HZS_1534 [Henneguya salminicola]